MEFIVGILGVLFGLFALGAALAGFFIWIGAKMAGVKNAGFGKSILVALASSFLSWFAAAALSIVPIIGTLLGLVIGLLLSVFVIKGVFDTSFGKAFLVWIFHLVAQVLAVLIGILTFAGVLVGGGATLGSQMIEKADPKSASAQEVATDREQQMRDARTIASALEGYAVDHGGYPSTDSIDELASHLSPVYIRALPLRDAGGRYRVSCTNSSYAIMSSSGEILLKSR